ncbi:hypothetical protein F7725_009583 [Dissostichus mawsoni]|uniref:Uncharacterized protein n=1 Tax=Dissostichus mawsoni TaxID=36200 RepID=A0A7J5XL47_DISMA|nr:hypothetical protein F7725_009583 [Dissostichus mawsoni]
MGMVLLYWSGDAVLQLAVVHIQSKVPWISIQLPDDLELNNASNFKASMNREFPKMLSTSRVLSMEMPLFCWLSHGLSHIC